MRDYPDSMNWGVKTWPLWAEPSPKMGILSCVRAGRASWAQACMRICCFWPWMESDLFPLIFVAVASPMWWTRSRKPVGACLGMVSMGSQSEYSIPSWRNCLGRTRMCDLIGGVSLGTGFKVSKDLWHSSVLSAADPRMRCGLSHSRCHAFAPFHQHGLIPTPEARSEDPIKCSLKNKLLCSGVLSQQKKSNQNKL